MEKVSCPVVYWLQESFDKRKAGLYNVVYTCKSLRSKQQIGVHLWIRKRS